MAKKKTNTGKFKAIYVRRSVSDKDKGNNSLSILAQKEECIRYVGNDEYKLYCDDGKSGKDIQHRPQFQMMMQDARDGLISTIIVKKYDRFSRNMREYLNITDELDKLGVSVYSLSEPFNTETKEGRMMRNNLLNFAEFERETIAARVADAYNTKARETGFYQGGKIYYGYNSERRTVNGKIGSVLVPNEQAEVIRLAYELYKDNSMSLRGVIAYFRENKISTTVPTNRTKSGLSNLDRTHLSRMLKSAIYVRADAEIYKYFSAKGYEMLDDISDYDGVHGVYVHQDPNSDNIFVKLGYHEGIVPSDTWLQVVDKKSRQQKFPNNGSAQTSFLVGLVKCAHCGSGITFSYTWHNNNKDKRWFYFTDTGAYKINGCVRKTLRKIKPKYLEETVLQAMKDRISQLEIAKHEAEKPDNESEHLKAEIIGIDEEIRKLMDKLADADDILFEYIQNRIKSLHEKKEECENNLRCKIRKAKAIDTTPLADPLSRWDELTMDEQHAVAVEMIDVIYISDETGIDIHFSI